MKTCWTPVLKGAPAENKIYNITYESVDGRRRSDSAYYNTGKRPGIGMRMKKRKLNEKL